MSLINLFPQVINDFTQFDLTPEQIHQGYILSPLQEAVLQNDLAELATKKVELVYSPERPFEIPELDGQIGNLKFILARSREKQALANAINEAASVPYNEEGEPAFASTNVFDL